jgi:predicted RNase H-like HicB family nuclease
VLYSAVERSPRNEVSTTKDTTPHPVAVVFARDADGLYAASVRVLRGCQAHGQTLEQVMQRTHAAVALSLATELPRPAVPALGFARAGAYQPAFPA